MYSITKCFCHFCFRAWKFKVLPFSEACSCNVSLGSSTTAVTVHFLHWSPCWNPAQKQVVWDDFLEFSVFKL